MYRDNNQVIKMVMKTVFLIFNEPQSNSVKFHTQTIFTPVISWFVGGLLMANCCSHV